MLLDWVNCFLGNFSLWALSSPWKKVKLDSFAVAYCSCPYSKLASLQTGGWKYKFKHAWKSQICQLVDTSQMPTCVSWHQFAKFTFPCTSAFRNWMLNQVIPCDCREGFPSERIEATLHSIELATKHQSSNFGLGLIMVFIKLHFLKVHDRYVKIHWGLCMKSSLITRNVSSVAQKLLQLVIQWYNVCKKPLAKWVNANFSPRFDQRDNAIHFLASIFHQLWTPCPSPQLDKQRKGN